MYARSLFFSLLGQIGVAGRSPLRVVYPETRPSARDALETARASRDILTEMAWSDPGIHEAECCREAANRYISSRI